MPKVYKQQAKRETVGILELNNIHCIEHTPNEPSKFDFSNRQLYASCVGCVNPRCMRFSAEELTLPDDRLAHFPIDMDDSVCPVNAITWERGEQTPTVDSTHCFNFGVCAQRCPFGAVYSDGNSAVINKTGENVRFVKITYESLNVHLEQSSASLVIGNSGSYESINAKTIGNVYKKLVAQSTDAQFSNIAVRNLLIALGNKCIIRRRGDVYFRIDAIASDKTIIGVFEVEFHKDSLESPCAILDDIAVLSARYKIDKISIKPFIVSLEFPNIRTEYWRVIKDIRNVLNIRINSLTLGALCAMTWSFKDVLIGSIDFYANVEFPSIKDAVSTVCELGELKNLTDFAVFETKKQHAKFSSISTTFRCLA
jgi:Fe-S-cluster-containing dehydrogenase component